MVSWQLINTYHKKPWCFWSFYNTSVTKYHCKQCRFYETQEQLWLDALPVNTNNFYCQDRLFMIWILFIADCKQSAAIPAQLLKFSFYIIWLICYYCLLRCALKLPSHFLYVSTIFWGAIWIIFFLTLFSQIMNL